MALEAGMARPFRGAGAGGDDEVLAARAASSSAFLRGDDDGSVDPVIWSDEKRMKRELVAWAKAVGRRVHGGGRQQRRVSTTPPAMRLKAYSHI
ncbi:unnamed protein product [Urochloa humidicola]